MEISAAADDRLMRTLRHIDAHLDQPLRLDDLAAVAAASPHHFHRRFREAVGLPVQRYVRLLRLRRASWRLAFRAEQTVTAIALESGFDSPDAFARAFRRCFGQSPSSFRGRPDWAAWASACAPIDLAPAAPTPPAAVAVVALPDIPVAMLSHRGDPAQLGETLRRFIAWRKGAGLPPRLSATFNILHGDPATVAADAFRLDLCAATRRPVEEDGSGVVAAVIPGGRHAVMRHVGPDAALGRTIGTLIGTWLPASGERRRGDAPLFLQRLSFFPDVPAHEAVSDVFLPLV